MMKKMAMMLTMLFVVGMMSSCIETNEEKPSTVLSIESDENSETTGDIELMQEHANEILDLGIETTEEVIESDEKDDYTAMIQRALIYQGNNYRMKRVIEKARAGEEINISYIGGSITEGHNSSPIAISSYAYLSFQGFMERFGQGNDSIHYHNEGISGTPSTLGLMRVDKDVLSNSPDLVFVEFAVNDGTDLFSQFMYEALVRRILESENAPAVILLFTVLENGYSAQHNMSLIGFHYNLPMISVKDALFPEIEAGRMTYYDDYGTDGVHPDNQGHELIAAFIDYYMGMVDASEMASEDILIDKHKLKVNYDDYESIVNGSGWIKDNGSFEYIDHKNFTYDEGWIKGTGIGSEPMVLELTFDELLIAHQQLNNASYGDLDVYVDDQKVDGLVGYDSGAWNNIIPTRIVNPFHDGEPHLVTLRMAEGDEEKGFIVLDMGYVIK